MTQVDFYFDLMCPWAYQASKWMRAASQQRDVDVDWRFFPLEEANWQEGKKHPWEREWSYGWSLLRVAAFLRREEGGREAVDRFYAVAGMQLHEAGLKVHTPEGARSAVELSGWSPALVSAALADERTNEAVLADYREARRLGVFGVPTLVMDGCHVLYGPVLAPAPDGAAAGRLWDAVIAWAEFPHLYEMQRPKMEADERHVRAVFTPYGHATDRIADLTMPSETQR